MPHTLYAFPSRVFDSLSGNGTSGSWNAVYASSAFSAIADAPDPAISIPVGIVVGLLASFVQSLGLTIQRKSHVQNEELPEAERRAEYKRP